MRGAEHSSTFSAFASAKAKIILLGESGSHFADLINQGRSLNIEHVSPASFVQQEISRRTPRGPMAVPAVGDGSAVPDRLLFALVRKWFWARKPDAGFLLEGFPATLLQALVFDEWLEARGENLTACFTAFPPGADPVATHYRTQGLPSGVISAAA